MKYIINKKGGGNFSFFVASGSNKDGIKKTASRDYDDTRWDCEA